MHYSDSGRLDKTMLLGSRNLEGPTRKPRHASVFQKNPRVRKIRVRNSGAGNGCAIFMDAWQKCALSAGKPMSIKFRVFGGGFGEVPILFLWARGFF